MFQIDDDMTIYITRGDVAYFSVTADNNGVPYKFKPGDVVRIKVFAKKDAANVVLQKDFPITVEVDKVNIYLEEKDTKIGEVISKPVDYWYEIELNPFTNPQTIVGYDDDGAKIFKLFPEGRDLTSTLTEDDIPLVDDELSMTSERPIQNQAVTRALFGLEKTCEHMHGIVEKEVEEWFDEDTGKVKEITREWLDEHPEATTTVQDNSIETSKFTDVTRLKVVKDYVTPQMFGAKADGVTDDTEALQNAIYYGQDNRCIIVLPKGDYAISKPLTLDDEKVMFFKMVGISPTCSIIRSLHNDYALNLNPTGITFKQCYISNITFINGSGGSGNAIYLKQATDYTIEHCIFRNFIYSIRLEKSWDGLINKCIFRERYNYAGHPMLLIGEQCNGVQVRECQFINANNVGTEMIFIKDGQASVLLDSCGFQDGAGILITPGNGRLNNLTILNGYFEWMTDCCVRVAGGDDVNAHNIHLLNCYFNGATSNTTPYAVYIGTAKNVIVENCYSARITTAIINNNAYVNKTLTVRNCNSLENVPITSGQCHYEIYDTAAPTGNYPVGTICWNENPTDGVIGWALSANGWEEF